MGTPFAGHPRTTNAWRFCALVSGQKVHFPAPLTEKIEVHASHIGTGINSLAPFAIADRPAQDPTHPQPFDQHGARRRAAAADHGPRSAVGPAAAFRRHHRHPRHPRQQRCAPRAKPRPGRRLHWRCCLHAAPMSPSPPRRKRSPSTSSAAPGDGVVTLDMVAQRAGVSPSTVSRILNGTASVSAEKRQAVDAAIALLRFRPNPVARGLAGGRTLSIGVLTQTINSPFYGEALRGIEDHLEPQGYIPIFVSGHWHEAEERKALEALLSRRVDGVIVLAGRLGNRELQQFAGSMPMVVVGRTLKGPRLFGLDFDNRSGGLLATRHLVECGHTRIAFIAGDPAHQDALDRHAGYRAALDEAGLRFDPALVIPGDFTETCGLIAVNHLFEHRLAFSAIFAANDQTAIGAALGLHRKNVRVPDDVSLVGFDDLAPAKFAIPPLTTVRQPIYEMGVQAATAMLDLLRGVDPDAALPAPQLVVRESTRRVHR